MVVYELTRSKRKTISIRINEDLKVLVRAPWRMPLREIEAFVIKNISWIENHQRSMAERNKRRRENALSLQEIEKLKIAAREVLPQRVAHYSQIMDLVPTGIKITAAKTRWGSCSAKNSLCFSYRLMLLPADLIDYIVVHELAHIRVKNHSAVFYREVAKYQPDYRECEARLKQIQEDLPQ